LRTFDAMLFDPPIDGTRRPPKRRVQPLVLIRITIP
jgi:hypothetical protein